MPLTPDPRTDQQLIDALARGEAAAFDILYHRHKEFISRLALRFTHDEADAMDVLQDTFSYFLGKARSGTFILTAKLTTFLYPVVKHQSMALRRSRGRDTSDEDILESVPSRREQLEGPGSLEGLHHVIAGLPGLHREVILLRFVDDLTLEEIATALEIPLGTVKSRLHNAIATLRQDPKTEAYFRP